MFEPTGPPRCEYVRVTGFHVGSKGPEFYRRVCHHAGGALDGWKIPDPVYTGLPWAFIILVSKGRWTGYDHVKVVETCPQ